MVCVGVGVLTKVCRQRLKRRKARRSQSKHCNGSAGCFWSGFGRFSRRLKI
jgi:hypothetical protein